MKGMLTASGLVMHCLDLNPSPQQDILLGKEMVLSSGSRGNVCAILIQI